MRIFMEATNEVVTYRGVEARRWKGTTDTGVMVDVFVPVIRVRSDADLSQFEAELKELPEPDAPPIPLRMLI